jgi:hypothetical protein
MGFTGIQCTLAVELVSSTGTDEPISEGITLEIEQTGQLLIAEVTLVAITLVASTIFTINTAPVVLTSLTTAVVTI